MSTPLFAELFATLNIVVLERQHQGTFRILSHVPTWFTRLYPQAVTQTEGLQLAEASPFLENFLVDAERFWSKQNVGQIKSGLWQEIDAVGKEYFLEAIAVFVDTNELLLITFPQIGYEEKLAIMQKARDNNLLYHQLAKEIEKKEILLHCIVHDLAGPLTALFGCLTLLEREELSATGKKYVDLGLNQATRQRMLIQQTLDVFALEMGASAGTRHHAAQAPDMFQCAQEVIGTLFPAILLRGSRIWLEPPDDVTDDWRIVGDEGRLERIIFNLVENALRHNPAHSDVTLSVQRDGEWVVLSVDDEGPGVPAEQVPKLFEKFSQGGNHSGKIGLGLHFCSITVTQWGGSIGYTPRPTGGSRFWVRLPHVTSLASSC